MQRSIESMATIMASRGPRRDGLFRVVARDIELASGATEPLGRGGRLYPGVSVGVPVEDHEESEASSYAPRGDHSVISSTIPAHDKIADPRRNPHDCA
jgi:hypothetical protein